MLTWILLIIVLAALVVVGTWSWGKIFGRGEVLAPMPEPKTTVEYNRRLVDGGDVADVRFELATRGYRPAQVDDVLDQLHRRLLETTAERDALRARLGEITGEGRAEKNYGTSPRSIE